MRSLPLPLLWVFGRCTRFVFGVRGEGSNDTPLEPTSGMLVFAIAQRTRSVAPHLYTAIPFSMAYPGNHEQHDDHASVKRRVSVVSMTTIRRLCSLLSIPIMHT
jgi:hypothetical protein